MTNKKYKFNTKIHIRLCKTMYCNKVLLLDISNKVVVFI